MERKTAVSAAAPPGRGVRDGSLETRCLDQAPGFFVLRVCGQRRLRATCRWPAVRGRRLFDRQCRAGRGKAAARCDFGFSCGIRARRLAATRSLRRRGFASSAGLVPAASAATGGERVRADQARPPCTSGAVRVPHVTTGAGVCAVDGANGAAGVAGIDDSGIPYARRSRFADFVTVRICRFVARSRVPCAGPASVRRGGSAPLTCGTRRSAAVLSAHSGWPRWPGRARGACRSGR